MSLERRSRDKFAFLTSKQPNINHNNRMYMRQDESEFYFGEDDQSNSESEQNQQRDKNKQLEDEQIEKQPINPTKNHQYNPQISQERRNSQETTCSINRRLKKQQNQTFVKNIILNNRFANLNQIFQLAKEQGITAKREDLMLMIRAMGFRRRRHILKEPCRNSEALIKSRKSWAKLVKQWENAEEDMFYYGTAVFTMQEYEGFMWIKIDKNGHIISYAQQKDILTLVIIQSKNSIEYFEIIEGKQKQEHFLRIIKDWAILLQNQMMEIEACDFNGKIQFDPEGKKHLLLHNTENHKQTIRQTKAEYVECVRQLNKMNIQLSFLPFYSSALNPTEIIFNTLRYDVRRRHPTSLAQVSQFLYQALTQLKEKDLQIANKDVQLCLDRAFQQIDLY